jgi:hypothetical protein
LAYSNIAYCTLNSHKNVACTKGGGRKLKEKMETAGKEKWPEI